MIDFMARNIGRLLALAVIHILVFGMAAPFIASFLWFFVFGYVCNNRLLGIDFKSLSECLVVSVIGLPISGGLSVVLASLSLVPQILILRHGSFRDIIIINMGIGVVSALTCAVFLGLTLEGGRWLGSILSVGIFAGLLSACIFPAMSCQILKGELLRRTHKIVW